MSGSVDLTIPTGTDWGIDLAWNDQFGEGYPLTDPVMTMRQGNNSTAKLIARLDETAQWDGTLTIVEPGKVRAIMTSTQTNKLVTGYGFWDLYATLWGNRVRVVFGTVNIAPHVTELTDA